MPRRSQYEEDSRYRCVIVVQQRSSRIPGPLLLASLLSTHHLCTCDSRRLVARSTANAYDLCRYHHPATLPHSATVST